MKSLIARTATIISVAFVAVILCSCVSKSSKGGEWYYSTTTSTIKGEDTEVIEYEEVLEEVTQSGSASQSKAKSTASSTKITERELIADPQFERGFYLLDTVDKEGSDVVGKLMFDKKSEAEPSWNFGQWSSVQSLLGTPLTKLGDMLVYQNDCKLFGMYKDTDGSNAVRLQQNGTPEWVSSGKKPGNAWPHVLIECGIKNYQTRCKLSSLKKLVFSLDVKINYVNSVGTDSESVTAQFNICNIIQNRSSGDDYGKMFWFCPSCYDYRYPTKSPSANLSLMYDNGTNSWITGPNNPNFYNDPKNGWDKRPGTHMGEWCHLEFDMLPYISTALDGVHGKNEMLNTKLSDLYLVGLNIGWEVPGPYDCSADCKNLSIKAYYK